VWQFFEASRVLNDNFSRAYFNNNASNRWLAIRLEFIGNMAVGCAALFAVRWQRRPVLWQTSAWRLRGPCVGRAVLC